MFKDEALDCVGIESLWRKSQRFANQSRGCQTQPVTSAEAEVQSLYTVDNGSQTEPPDQLMEQYLQQKHHDPEAPGLKNFLDCVEDTVIQELAKNAKSHAFDGFQANWEDQSRLVACLHCLHYPRAQEKHLHTTSISWNSTGSVVACSYGRTDNGDWSTEKSYVCTWNVDRRGMNPAQPDVTIDVSTPVMSLAFHPNRPSVIAGGLYSGDVVVWDTGRTQDPVMAQTTMSPDSHREPVNQVDWVPLEKRGELGVLSACSRGRVLLWVVDPDHGRLVLNAGYALVRQVPHIKTRGTSHIGVTSLALSPWDSDTFLVGSEGGLLLKCSFSSLTPAVVSSEGQSVILRDPAVFSFRPCSSPVHSIHCSPFQRNLFLSVGTDGLAHLHSLLQASPLLSLRVSDSYVFDVHWSPTRPLVFAAATGEGVVHIFDLGRRTLKPVATIHQGSDDKAATCVSFNFSNTNLLAVGSTDGTVHIWQLSSNLTEQRPREIIQLEQLANDMAE